MTTASITAVDTLAERFPAHAVDVVRALDARIERVAAGVKASAMWRTLTDPATEDVTVLAIVREIFRTIAAYQPRTAEAGFYMVGRLPKGDLDLLRALVGHRVEEGEHGLWAAEDFAACGGDRRELARPLSPACVAVAAIWHFMAEYEEPLAYLGGEYLFEMLTPLIAGDALGEFRRRDLQLKPFRFIVEHATEDIKHSNMFKIVICQYLTKYPDGGPAILRGFDYFNHVYPLPVWQEALERATSKNS